MLGWRSSGLSPRPCSGTGCSALERVGEEHEQRGEEAGEAEQHGLRVGGDVAHPPAAREQRERSTTATAARPTAAAIPPAPTRRRPRGRSAGVVVLECSATTARLKSERRNAPLEDREREREHDRERVHGTAARLDPRGPPRAHAVDRGGDAVDGEDERQEQACATERHGHQAGPGARRLARCRCGRGRAAAAPRSGEADEHQRDADELADVDERVLAGAREAGGQREHERAARDPQVGAHAPAAQRSSTARRRAGARCRTSSARSPTGTRARRARRWPAGRRSARGRARPPSTGASSDRDRGRHRGHGQRADERVAPAGGSCSQAEPAPSQATVSTPPAQVVAAEQPGAPARALGDRLARRWRPRTARTRRPTAASRPRAAGATSAAGAP